MLVPGVEVGGSSLHGCMHGIGQNYRQSIRISRSHSHGTVLNSLIPTD